MSRSLLLRNNSSDEEGSHNEEFSLMDNQLSARLNGFYMQWWPRFFSPVCGRTMMLTCFKFSRVEWGGAPGILVLRRLMRNNGAVKASLSHTVTPCLKKNPQSIKSFPILFWRSKIGIYFGFVCFGFFFFLSLLNKNVLLLKFMKLCLSNL